MSVMSAATYYERLAVVSRRAGLYREDGGRDDEVVELDIAPPAHVTPANQDVVVVEVKDARGFGGLAICAQHGTAIGRRAPQRPRVEVAIKRAKTSEGEGTMQASHERSRTDEAPFACAAAQTPTTDHHVIPDFLIAGPPPNRSVDVRYVSDTLHYREQFSQNT